MTQDLFSIPALCINLDRRADRWTRCEPLWRPLFPRLTRYSAVDATKTRLPDGYPGTRCGFYGSWLSHTGAARWCLQQGYDLALILEDDAVPRADFRHMLPAVYASTPRNFEVLYLGKQNWTPHVEINHGAVRLRRSTRTHAYILSRAGMVQIASMLWPDPHGQAFDVAMFQVQARWTCYGPHASIVGQFESWSDNEGRHDRGSAY